MIAKALAKIFGYSESRIDDLMNTRNPISEVVSSDSIKWYDHDSDMLELSEKFPDFWFELIGEGEERDDNWSALYHNGKMQEVRAELVWPDYNLIWFNT